MLIKTGLIFGFVFSFLIGCSSTTMIKTTDANAKIYVDGEFKGTGAVSHTDQKIVGSTTAIKIAKDGCQSEIFQLQRNESVDAGAVVGGIFFLPAFLWVMEYKPEHLYEYQCKQTKVASSEE